MGEKYLLTTVGSHESNAAVQGLIRTHARTLYAKLSPSLKITHKSFELRGLVDGRGIEDRPER